MIIDSIKSFERYTGIHESFADVCRFLKENNLSLLEDGDYEISGDRVRCRISVQDAKSIDEMPRLEVHDSHIDIHIVIEGSETIGFKSRGACDGTGVEYDAERDIAFFADAPETFVNYAGDNFVICFPTDAHAPLIGNGRIRKAVFKVLV